MSGHSLSSTAYQRLMDFTSQSGPYNPRSPIYSNQMGIEICNDLYESSSIFKGHVHRGELCHFLNLPLSKPRGDIAIEIDLIVGELKKPLDLQTTLAPLKGCPLPKVENSQADRMKTARIIIEHKSVITAHRNRGNRSKELVAVRDVIVEAYPNAVLVANVLIGTARKYLNYEVIDRAKKALDVLCGNLVGGYDLGDLIKHIGTNHPDLHAFLSNEAVAGLLLSENTKQDSEKTLKHLKAKLPLRSDITGKHYDVLMIQFCHIDNIGPPRLVDPPFFAEEKYNALRYENALDRMIELYEERFR